MIEVKSNNVYLDGRATNFDIRELVPKEVYQSYGERSIRFLQRSGLEFLQFSRVFFNAPHYVNNWHVGGNLNLRGYRPPYAGIIKQVESRGFIDYSKDLRRELSDKGFDIETMGTGSWYSDHKMGIAYDWNVSGMTADQTRREIMDNQDVFMDYGLTTLEDAKYAPTWVHGSSRETGMTAILIIKP